MITASIDVTKVDKDHLYQGKKGKYLSLVFFDKKSEKDDGYIVQGVSKEAREKGIKGAIIGNWRESGRKPSRAQSGNNAQPAQSAASTTEDPDSVPF